MEKTEGPILKFGQENLALDGLVKTLTLWWAEKHGL